LNFRDVLYTCAVSTPILATKLFIPPPKPGIVPRPQLVERLNEGVARDRKLTLISAPAGFGKTTLVSEWIEDCGSKIADFKLNTSGLIPSTNQKSEIKNPQFCWLSLDDGDNDLTRFLTYLVAALQTLAPNIGMGVLAVLQSPQPPSAESILTTLLNEITIVPDHFILVLDDYHILDSNPVDKALTFLLEHLPPQMHLVIASREDPHLPLARLRARGQLTELRLADLRFTPAEAADFLNQVMGLNLSAENISTLETRTEGWIAGLQLAALSMQGHHNASSFIKSFTGSHHFVLDYLVEEVLKQQPESIQTFLLRTSILNRLCGPLCDAVLLDPSASGQATLEYLEHANLFIVSLDNERRWYRYHHLFGELLRKRLGQSLTPEEIAEQNIHASQWYEDKGLELEAFQHAAAANDVERAERLIEGDGIPRHLLGAVATILDWLKSLPTTTLDARPSLWWRYATFLMFNGQTTGVDEKLQAAENALQGLEANDKARNLIGQIAGTRAMLALTRYQVKNLLVQSRRALEYIHPKNLSSRASANLTLGFAYFLQGDRAAARQSYLESIKLSQECGNTFITILATNGLGYVLEIETQLHQAAETYQHSLQLFGDQPLHTHAGQASLGLARISYEWNDLESAEQYGQQSLQQVRQYDDVIDRFVVSEVFLARLKLVRGDVEGAAAILVQTEQSARQRNFILRMPEIAAAHVLVLLRQGELVTAAQLAQQYELPLSQARVLLVQGDPSAALAVLEPWRRQAEDRGWADERLKAMVLQAIALHQKGELAPAVQVLGEALTLAEPGGFIRIFVDEGEPVRLLIADFRLQIEKLLPNKSHPLGLYVDKLLMAFSQPFEADPKSQIKNQKSEMKEPLSHRELEILRLIAQGLSNTEISQRLFLAVNTIKGHNRRIFGKMQAQNRTEAVARARELGLL
jgi:LuxR family transcriptional regulator, maltose regulon positive regulatory protein